MSSNPGTTASFDQYATNYHDELNRGLALSGESSEYFAGARIALLSELLRQLGARPRRAMDFGCGVGSAVPLLLQLDGVEAVLGTDASPASLDVARERYRSLPVEFVPITADVAHTVDLAYCNGVFHHIPPSERSAAVEYVATALREGGLFALWENNPWNPGTRLIMRRIPFDRDAQMLSSRAVRRLLRSAGFEIVRTDFAFIFPRMLRFLRPLERYAARLPIGGQYMVLARRA